MSKTEIKRKPGRPSARQEPEPSEQTDMPAAPEAPRPAALDSWRPKPMPKAGPVCERCNERTDINTEVFRALGQTVIRCTKCKTAAIADDTHYFDIKTAATGVLLRRALAVYEMKHPSMPTPKVQEDAVTQILESEADDPRWEQ